MTFEKLEDWTKRPESGIKYYSGKATYRQRFDLPAVAPGGKLLIWTWARSRMSPMCGSTVKRWDSSGVRRGE